MSPFDAHGTVDWQRADSNSVTIPRLERVRKHAFEIMMSFIRTVASTNASSSQKRKIDSFWYNYCRYKEPYFDLWEETEFVRLLLTSFDRQQDPPTIIVGVSCSFELVARAFVALLTDDEGNSPVKLSSSETDIIFHFRARNVTYQYYFGQIQVFPASELQDYPPDTPNHTMRIICGTLPEHTETPEPKVTVPREPIPAFTDSLNISDFIELEAKEVSSHALIPHLEKTKQLFQSDLQDFIEHRDSYDLKLIPAAIDMMNWHSHASDHLIENWKNFVPYRDAYDATIISDLLDMDGISHALNFIEKWMNFVPYRDTYDKVMFPLDSHGFLKTNGTCFLPFRDAINLILAH